jgi:GNAT superfamily N-acetyltransferase
MRDLAAANKVNCNLYELRVAEAPNNTILAYGTLVKAPEAPWFLKVHTHPDHKGKGAATALYNHLEATAIEQGAEQLESSVRSDDDAAFAWAERRSST